MNHPRIVHLCNVKEVAPSKRLNSKASIYLFYLFLSWFHNNITEIRIYGCELCPYKLPKYVPMRLFELEYFRQLINANLTHFCNVKKKA